MSCFDDWTFHRELDPAEKGVLPVALRRVEGAVHAWAASAPIRGSLDLNDLLAAVYLQGVKDGATVAVDVGFVPKDDP